MGFWLACFSIAYKLLKYFKGAEDIGTMLAGKVLAMILMAFGSILLLSNIVSALSNFFLARDLDQIAAAPVRGWSLYLARLAETTLHSSWMVVLLLVPILSAYGVAYGANWPFILFAILVMSAYLLIPAALGAAVTLVLVNVFPARRTRGSGHADSARRRRERSAGVLTRGNVPCSTGCSHGCRQRDASSC